MTQQELDKVIAEHQRWLCGGTKKRHFMRANLIGEDLRGLNLSNANLEKAILSEAILDKANLSNADLRGAEMHGTRLYRAHLKNANMSCAAMVAVDLSCAMLSGASFYKSNLERANLEHTNCNNAMFVDARLCRTNLGSAWCAGADFSGADMRNVILFGSDMSKAINVPYIPMACPSSGSFIAYKKAMLGYIVKLMIPGDAKRSSATTRICRADKALVLDILNEDGSTSGKTDAYSIYDSRFLYRVGTMVEVKNFDNNRWNECAAGIHFFIDFYDAANY